MITKCKSFVTMKSKAMGNVYIEACYFCALVRLYSGCGTL